MKTPQNIYNHFVEFEETAAAIYVAMAAHFSPRYPELGSLWLNMGVQEREHAGLLHFCLAEGLFATRLPNGRAIGSIQALFRSLEKRASDPALTIDEAFAIAAEMENSEVGAIYSHLTSTLHNSMYLLRRKIMASVPYHVGGLVAAARKFNVSNKVIERLEHLEPKRAA